MKTTYAILVSILLSSASQVPAQLSPLGGEWFPLPISYQNTNSPSLSPNVNDHRIWSNLYFAARERCHITGVATMKWYSITGTNIGDILARTNGFLEELDAKIDELLPHFVSTNYARGFSTITNGPWIRPPGCIFCEMEPFGDAYDIPVPVTVYDNWYRITRVEDGVYYTNWYAYPPALNKMDYFDKANQYDHGSNRPGMLDYVGKIVYPIRDPWGYCLPDGTSNIIDGRVYVSSSHNTTWPAYDLNSCTKMRRPTTYRATILDAYYKYSTNDVDNENGWWMIEKQFNYSSAIENYFRPAWNDLMFNMGVFPVAQYHRSVTSSFTSATMILDGGAQAFEYVPDPFGTLNSQEIRSFTTPNPFTLTFTNTSPIQLTNRFWRISFYNEAIDSGAVRWDTPEALPNDRITITYDLTALQLFTISGDVYYQYAGGTKNYYGITGSRWGTVLTPQAIDERAFTLNAMRWTTSSVCYWAGHEGHIDIQITNDFWSIQTQATNGVDSNGDMPDETIYTPPEVIPWWMVDGAYDALPDIEYKPYENIPAYTNIAVGDMQNIGPRWSIGGTLNMFFDEVAMYYAPIPNNQLTACDIDPPIFYEGRENWEMTASLEAYAALNLMATQINARIVVADINTNYAHKVDFYVYGSNGYTGVGFTDPYRGETNLIYSTGIAFCDDTTPITSNAIVTSKWFYATNLFMPESLMIKPTNSVNIDTVWTVARTIYTNLTSTEFNEELCFDYTNMVCTNLIEVADNVVVREFPQEYDCDGTMLYWTNVTITHDVYYSATTTMVYDTYCTNMNWFQITNVPALWNHCEEPPPVFSNLLVTVTNCSDYPVGIPTNYETVIVLRFIDCPSGPVFTETETTIWIYHGIYGPYCEVTSTPSMEMYPESYRTNHEVCCENVGAIVDHGLKWSVGIIPAQSNYTYDAFIHKWVPVIRWDVQGGLRFQ